MRIKLRMSMLVMLKKNLRSSKLLARSNLNFLNTTTLDLILKGLLEMFLFSNKNLNTVTLERFIQSKVFVTNITFDHCPLCVLKLKIKSDFKGSH